MAEEPKKDPGAAGRRKAAAFMLALDAESAALIMSRFGEREIQMISEEMTKIGELTGTELEDLLKSFNTSIGGDRVQVEPMVEDILVRALGKEKAKELLEKIRRQSRDSEPFRSLLSLDAQQVSQLLRGEHPQVIALVISHLETKVSSAILKDMAEDLRYEVIKRIASTDELPSELVRQVDEMMEVRAYSLGRRSSDDDGQRRFKNVAQMLNVSDPSVSKSIMDRLNKEIPAIANQIQNLMFVFDDMIKIGDKDMQKVMAGVDKADLLLALRAATPDIQGKILNNMSSRARDAAKEEMEMMGPKKLSEIEEAQKRILQVVREMEEKGEITVDRGGASEKMV